MMISHRCLKLFCNESRREVYLPAKAWESQDLHTASPNCLGEVSGDAAMTRRRRLQYSPPPQGGAGRDADLYAHVASSFRAQRSLEEPLPLPPAPWKHWSKFDNKSDLQKRAENHAKRHLTKTPNRFKIFEGPKITLRTLSGSWSGTRLEKASPPEAPRKPKG